MTTFARTDDTGDMLLSWVPEWMQDDPHVRAICGVIGRELGRIDATLHDVSEQVFPTHATDEYGLLAMWEEFLQVPAHPPGASVEQRQSLLQANLMKRHSGSGTDWQRALSLALGPSVVWEYQEDTNPYEVTLRLPSGSGSYSAVQVLRLARRVTPAHIDIAVTYGGGFIIGVSQIGVEDL